MLSVLKRINPTQDFVFYPVDSIREEKDATTKTQIEVRFSNKAPYSFSEEVIIKEIIPEIVEIKYTAKEE